MTTIYLGKRRRNNNSFLYRVEARKNIFSGTYEEVLDYVEKTYGGSKTSIDSIGREYIPLNKKELREFEEILYLKRVSRRKSPEIGPTRDHIYTDQKEWSEMIKKIDERLKKY